MPPDRRSVHLSLHRVKMFLQSVDKPFYLPNEIIVLDFNRHHPVSPAPLFDFLSAVFFICEDRKMAGIDQISLACRALKDEDFVGVALPVLAEFDPIKAAIFSALRMT